MTAALPGFGHAAAPAPLMRPIPKSGERIPAVGMGTWITFNVGQNTALRDQRTEVLRTFFDMGGGMVDSSPMYGSAEDVMGYCLERLPSTKGLFSATKVWTPSDSEGVEQVADSMRLWGLNKFDLFQVHNLVNWENHLAMLRERKQQGDIRYIGITTSHGGRHDEMLRIMNTKDIDFVQFTYNLLDRDAEQRLLPLAAERDIEAETARLIQAMQDVQGRLVLVANELGLGVVPENAMARAFRNHHGTLNQAVAAAADRRPRSRSR